MATPAITIQFDTSNTNVAPNPVHYNMEVTVDLSDIWSYIVGHNNANRIYVETNLRIPTLHDTVPGEIDLTIIDYFNIVDIVDKKVTQYAYFEGVYDDTRETVSNSSIWSYGMIASQ